jgi:phosphopantetheinyl transferase
MVTGAPHRGTISPPPHQPHRSGATATRMVPGLDPDAPVLYASDLAGPGAKERLVRRLLAALPGQETGGASPPLILETTALGQPRLLLHGQPGPAISFSRAAGRLWAAMTPAGQVGLDLALPSEFEASYPWSRAFQPPELAWALPLTRGDTARAAALLWALKEAAVKALGVGFHLLDPLAVAALNPRPWQNGVRVSVQAGRLLPAWVWPEAGGWLAISLNY